MLRSLITTSLVFLCAVLLGGAIPAQSAERSPLLPQATCPEMGAPVNPELYVDHNGKRIYLCCEMCRDAVAKDPERAMRAIEAKGQIVQAIPTKDSPAALPPKKKTLGVLLFPRFEMLDAYGPMELWGNMKDKVQVITVAAQAGEVPSNQGPKTVADYGFDDAPQLDLLLIPGGLGAFDLVRDQKTLEWLRKRAKKAEIVMSVCNGASLLAAAGILDGRPATTNKMFWKSSTDPGPKVKWVKSARWVDDGTVVTSSGVSAGIDMSLAVIARLYGKDVAEWLARVTEYEPHGDSSWDPFAKAAGLVE